MPEFRLRHVLLMIALALGGLIGSMFVLQGQIDPRTFTGVELRFDPVRHPQSGPLVLLPPDRGPSSKDPAIDLPPDLPVRAAEFGPEKLYFHRNPALLIWTVLISVMVALAFSLTAVVLAELGRLIRDHRIESKRVAAYLGATLLVAAAVSAVVHRSDYFATPRLWMEWLSVLLHNPTAVLWTAIVIGFLPAVLALCGQLLVSAATERLAPPSDNDSPESLERLADRFERLRGTLRLFLMTVSILVVMSVLTTDALRQALKNVVTGQGVELFPPQFVYMYGLFFAIILASFYLPVYYQLRAHGRWLIERIRAGELPERTDAKSSLQRLQLHESALDNLKTALSIVAPLLSSFLPELIRLDL